MLYYLYVKTHSVTGLKYLGQTRRKDPHKYSGSGKYWTSHLKKHGKHYTTEILKECSSTEELSFWGKYYSSLWNVTESNEWANLKPEAGDGGWYLYGDLNPQKRSDIRQKTSEGMKRFLKENPNIREARKQWRHDYWTEEKKKEHKYGGLGTVTVTDIEGNSKRIPKEDYDSMDKSGSMEFWEYVPVATKESKRRKETHALRTVVVTTM